MGAPAPKEVYNFRVYLIAMIASMGAIIFGYDLAFIGEEESLLRRLWLQLTSSSHRH